MLRPYMYDVHEQLEASRWTLLLLGGMEEAVVELTHPRHLAPGAHTRTGATISTSDSARGGGERPHRPAPNAP